MLSAELHKALIIEQYSITQFNENLDLIKSSMSSVEYCTYSDYNVHNSHTIIDMCDNRQNNNCFTNNIIPIHHGLLLLFFLNK